MASTADMSLDAIIRNRRSGGNFRGRGRPQRGRGIVRPFTSGRMAGIARRGPLGVNARPSSYTIAKARIGSVDFLGYDSSLACRLNSTGIL